MRTWIPAGAALLLVVGVLATRGSTAAAEDDLLPPLADPPASTEPSPGLLDGVDEAVVVEANGIPGMRLGTDGRELQNPFEGPERFSSGRVVEPPNGCSPAYREQLGSSSRTWDTSAWLVDGLVSAVVLSRWDSSSPVRPGVTTWLGPTLGSPVEAAAELPGARTTTERPFGTAGPEVTVVVVPGDGVEVVFSDASSDPRSRPEAESGRITTLEVRHPRARPCAMQDLQAASSLTRDGEPEVAPVSVGLDGLAAAPLGTPVEVVRDLPGITAEPDVLGACENFYLDTAVDAFVRLVVVDGVLVFVQAYSPVATDLGVVPGDSVADVQAAYPQLAARGGVIVPGTVEVVLEDRVLGFDMWPAQAWIPEVDVPVTGGPPVVQGVSVRDGAVDPSRLC